MGRRSGRGIIGPAFSFTRRGAFRPSVVRAGATRPRGAPLVDRLGPPTRFGRDTAPAGRPYGASRRASGAPSPSCRPETRRVDPSLNVRPGLVPSLRAGRASSRRGRSSWVLGPRRGADRVPSRALDDFVPESAALPTTRRLSGRRAVEAGAPTRRAGRPTNRRSASGASSRRTGRPAPAEGAAPRDLLFDRGDPARAAPDPVGPPALFGTRSPVRRCSDMT